MAKERQAMGAWAGRAPMGRRELLARSMPACAAACLGGAVSPELLAAAMGGREVHAESAGQETHKFDEVRQRELSNRNLVQIQNQALMGLIRTLQEEVGDGETIRILNRYSTEVGRQAGQRQAARAGNNDFASFVAQFRPPNFANRLTHEVVEDTETTFEIRVTECIWAEVFRDAGLAGELGHAAVCQMDYHTPVAFNPAIRMERDKTLMQGHDCCNHRYILST